MSKALRSYNSNANPPVGERLSDYQVKNNTGGYVDTVDLKTRLERFLILGVDGGTYYVSEKDLTKQNVDFIVNFIKTDPGLVLQTVIDVSTTGRSYRNSAAIFVLALMLNHAPGDWKRAVSLAVKDVARTGTAIYEFADFIEKLGGWGRAKRSAVAQWFTSKTPEDLAYQAVKYRQRNGWTLRDLMRLSHPVGLNQSVGKFILGNYMGKFSDYDPSMPGIIHGFTEMQRNSSTSEVVETLERYPNLPWETIPTQLLKDPEVWKTLFYNNSINGQALLRNVVRLAKIGAFSDIKFAGDYAQKLADKNMIRKTRLHPVQYFLAGLTYSRGQKERKLYGGFGLSYHKTWESNAKISEALETGFYGSFANVTPSGVPIRIGVDVSGSMHWTSAIGADISASEGAALMALVTAKVEPYVEIVGFAGTLRDLNIGPADSFESVIRKTNNATFGMTDPSLLIKTANSSTEAFLVVTDNEVNSGTHPALELKNHRQRTGHDAKLVVMGMSATDFTIANPNDPGMMDVVGFDASAPKVVSDFISGKI